MSNFITHVLLYIKNDFFTHLAFVAAIGVVVTALLYCFRVYRLKREGEL